MKKVSYLIGLIFLATLSSCKINQKANGEHIGKWVYRSTIDNHVYLQKGRYRKDGFQKGTWRYKEDGKLYKKEEFKDSLATVTYYHRNGKIHERGQFIFRKEGDGLHYFYTGSWFVYDTKGNLKAVKHYDDGILKHETIIKL